MAWEPFTVYISGKNVWLRVNLTSNQMICRKRNGKNILDILLHAEMAFSCHFTVCRDGISVRSGRELRIEYLRNDGENN